MRCEKDGLLSCPATCGGGDASPAAGQPLQIPEPRLPAPAGQLLPNSFGSTQQLLPDSLVSTQQLLADSLVSSQQLLAESPPASPGGFPRQISASGAGLAHDGAPCAHATNKRKKQESMV